jgi:hypothetical protein
MALADELWKLQELHQRGELSDDEYARAKAAVLAGLLRVKAGSWTNCRGKWTMSRGARRSPTSTALGTGNARIT